MRSQTKFNEAAFGEFLARSLKKVETEVDIDELTELTKLYKKHVPFFRRSYMGAYLAKLAFSDVKVGERPSRFASTGEKPVRIEIPEEDSAQLFFGAGKIRRVFPRDIIEFIMTNTNTARERIGRIRTFPNYSFVQVYRSDADDLIAMLNNKECRGKTITVSYSKKRIPETEEATETT